MKSSVFLNAMKAFAVAAFAVAATTGLSVAQGDAEHGTLAAGPTTQTVATVAGDQDDHGWG
ncbi:hypothetical protein [Streptomyces sp. NPDC085529]|uniref:hypothetical protein n=1 Tax=Streptomyces sp. NPDC085529 TaxID=3365729 RepID=UPI0037D9641F